MNLKSVALVSLLAMAGAALTGGAYWALLNVPESNVLALAFSALLVVLIAVIAGYALSVALSAASGSSIGQAVQEGVRGVPGFLTGGIVFVVLWYLTTSIDAQWTEHAGEIDALFLRYAGTAHTAWLHTTVGWVLWLIRWGVGAAVVAGATTTSVTRGSIGRGLSLSVSPLPLGATLLALFVAYELWAFVYWRPKGLPADSAELAFVSAKLAVLAVVNAVLVAIVCHVFTRAAATARR
ncbi:MAG: hypothetical protein U0Q11_17800 [Vicinamibacterales bacterium]